MTGRDEYGIIGSQERSDLLLALCRADDVHSEWTDAGLTRLLAALEEM